MGLSELLVILAGLIVGWALVSRIISTFSRETQEVEDGDWWDILGVSAESSSDQIEAAYDKKCRELKERERRIMTISEQEKEAQIRARIDSAYRRSSTSEKD